MYLPINIYRYKLTDNRMNPLFMRSERDNSNKQQQCLILSIR